MTLTASSTPKMFIAGEWKDASDGETTPVINPATEEVIAQVPKGTIADADRAVAAARAAFETWSRVSPADRAGMLLKFADAVSANTEELAKVESANVGKPMGVARFDVEFSIDNLRYFAGAARVIEGKATAEYSPSHTSMIRRDPVGVVAQVAPWNYPLMMAIWKLGPALAAGNTVILKPSSWTPLTALMLAELMAEIFPPGVVNVLTGPGPVVGAHLVGHPDVDMVSLTGDTATGRKIAAQAAATVKRVHLELGGKAPVLVYEDADMEAVAAGVRVGGFFNTGQDCTAATRVLVRDNAYDKLMSELVPAVKQITVGDPASSPDDLEMGPLVAKAQQERVAGFVERAVAAGGEVAAGGSTIGPKGFFFEPSLVIGVSQSSEIVQQEVFGPVVTVQRFSSEEEGLAWANGTPFGLAASVWTRDVKKALRAARALRFGTVWINDHLAMASEMPHGGFKQSGYGKDLSSYALEDYTVVKHVMAKIVD